MKLSHRFTLAVFLGMVAATGGAAAPAAEKSDARVTVTFSDPDKFTDAADAERGSSIRREDNLAELEDYIVRRAGQYLADGQRMRVTVTDVDLAGEVEPWRTQAHDVRIVKDIYPPRIDLSYQLLDANGAVLKEGERSLKDMMFNWKITMNRTDARVHEKALIDDWLRSDFKRSKK